MNTDLMELISQYFEESKDISDNTGNADAASESAEPTITIRLLDAMFEPAEKHNYTVRFLLSPRKGLKPARYLYFTDKQDSPLSRSNLQRQFWHLATVKEKSATFLNELYKIVNRTWIVIHISENMPDLHGKGLCIEKSVNWDHYWRNNTFNYSDVFQETLLQAMSGRKFELDCRPKTSKKKITVHNGSKGTYQIEYPVEQRGTADHVILKSEFTECRIELHIMFR